MASWLFMNEKFSWEQFHNKLFSEDVIFVLHDSLSVAQMIVVLLGFFILWET